jgi:UDP-N-acetylmuramyl pentapeptide synthase
MLMVAHIADYMSVPVGAAEASGLWIDTRVKQQGDAAEPSDVAVFMSAREGRAEEVVEAARRGATLLLNADDPRLCEAVSEGYLAGGGATSRVAYFSADPSSPVIRAHREAGGLAYVLQGGWIVEARGASETRVVRASEIQTTLGGTARHEIPNALAAVAAARAAGFGVAEILCALRTFERASAALAG